MPSTNGWPIEFILEMNPDKPIGGTDVYLPLRPVDRSRTVDRCNNLLSLSREQANSGPSGI